MEASIAHLRWLLLPVLGVLCSLSSPAESLTFFDFNGKNTSFQGSFSFTPGIGNVLTIGAGNGGLGGPITNLNSNGAFCGGDCAVTDGYSIMTTGPEDLTASFEGDAVYFFGAGGSIDIYGGIASLGIPGGSLLFSASFVDSSLQTGPGGANFASEVDASSVFLNPTLGVYGYADAEAFDAFDLFGTSCQSFGECSGSILSSSAQANASPIPEPSALVALIAFAAAAMGIRRSKHLC